MKTAFSEAAARNGGITYTVTSLDEMAAFFEQQAANAERRQAGARPTESKVLAGEIRTWRSAAAMLRVTTVVPKEPAK